MPANPIAFSFHFSGVAWSTRQAIQGAFERSLCVLGSVFDSLPGARVLELDGNPRLACVDTSLPMRLEDACSPGSAVWLRIVCVARLCLAAAVSCVYAGAQQSAPDLNQYLRPLEPDRRSQQGTWKPPRN